MGMPISLALRGRHADDRYGEAAWARALAVLHEADRVFSTYRADSLVSRLGRGEITRRGLPGRGRARCSRSASSPASQSGGAFDVRRRGRRRRPVLDPSGVVKGWAVQRAAHALRRPRRHRRLPVRGRRHGLPGRRPGARPPGASASRTRATPAGSSPSYPCATARSPPRRRPTGATHIVDARTGEVPRGVASVTVVADDLTWADIDATAAFAQGADARRWLESRPGRRGVVVGDDGSVQAYATA